MSEIQYKCQYCGHRFVAAEGAEVCPACNCRELEQFAKSPKSERGLGKEGGGEAAEWGDKFFSELLWANRPECKSFVNRGDSLIIKMAKLSRLAREGRIPKERADEECRVMMDELRELYRACGNPP